MRLHHLPQNVLVLAVAPTQNLLRHQILVELLPVLVLPLWGRVLVFVLVIRNLEALQNFLRACPVSTQNLAVPLVINHHVDRIAAARAIRVVVGSNEVDVKRIGLLAVADA